MPNMGNTYLFVCLSYHDDDTLVWEVEKCEVMPFVAVPTYIFMYETVELAGMLFCEMYFCLTIPMRAVGLE